MIYSDLQLFNDNYNRKLPPPKNAICLAGIVPAELTSGDNNTTHNEP